MKSVANIHCYHMITLAAIVCHIIPFRNILNEETAADEATAAGRHSARGDWSACSGCRAGGAARVCGTARGQQLRHTDATPTHLHHHHVTPRAATFTPTLGTQDTAGHTSTTGAIVTTSYGVQDGSFKVIIYKWSLVHHAFPADLILLECCRGAR